MSGWTQRAETAYGYSLARMALNLYLFTEENPSVNVSEDMSHMRINNHRECFARLLKAYLGGEIFLDALDDLRRSMLKEMDTIVAFTDVFSTYEYALNRMEYRFTEKKCEEMPGDEAFAALIMQYLTAEENPSVVNRRIQDVIGQLPVRMTRKKFFSILRDALAVYKGADRGSFDQTLYLLRMAGLIQMKKEQREDYPQLNELLKEMEKADFSKLDTEQYRKLIQITEMAGERLFVLSEKIQSLQELINDLYVLAIVGEDGPAGQEYEHHALHILQSLCDMVTLGGEEIPMEIQEELIFLEGVQETCLEQYHSLRAASEAETKESLLDRLLSNSTFASLEEEKQELLDPKDVEKDTELLICELDQVFSQVQKPVIRAIMATILSNLPVFFQSLAEIQEFILGSFASCLDKGEKEICKELLFQLMEMDDYEVV